MFALISGFALSARVGIEVSLNRNVFMRFEHIYACVTLRNDSGKPLLFGGDPALQGFLLFDIRDSYNRPVHARKNAEISVFGLAYATNLCYLVAFLLNLLYNLRVSRQRKNKQETEKEE